MNNHTSQCISWARRFRSMCQRSLGCTFRRSDQLEAEQTCSPPWAFAHWAIDMVSYGQVPLLTLSGGLMASGARSQTQSFDKHASLRAHPFFRDLGPRSSIVWLPASSHPRSEKASVIFRKGDIGSKLYAVRSGAVRISAPSGGRQRRNIQFGGSWRAFRRDRLSRWRATDRRRCRNRQLRVDGHRTSRLSSP